MTDIKSISVSKEFSDLAREFHLSWSEASRIGMSIMLGDLGIKQYDNRINLFRKMDHFRRIAEKSLEEVEVLKTELEIRSLSYNVEKQFKGSDQESKGTESLEKNEPTKNA